ncbi:PREDICTED: collagen alpha-2(I) chain-like, partial [Chinchilla lanigera]|uniref:collagen alpha-2(I) chain-like n=1 Tax=Chinchilla lanigera TaxID=34839 RepID=UPI000698760A
EAGPCDYPGGRRSDGRHFPHRGEEAAVDLPAGFSERVLDTSGLCLAGAERCPVGRERKERQGGRRPTAPSGPPAPARRVVPGEASACPQLRLPAAVPGCGFRAGLRLPAPGTPGAAGGRGCRSRGPAGSSASAAASEPAGTLRVLWRIRGRRGSLGSAERASRRPLYVPALEYKELEKWGGEGAAPRAVLLSRGAVVGACAGTVLVRPTQPFAKSPNVVLQGGVREARLYFGDQAAEEEVSV